MAQLRIWITATILWLLVFFNIERFHEPINLASVVYVFAALVAVVIVAFRSILSTPSWLLWSSIACVFLISKLALGYELAGESLPLTVTEATALAITIFFAQGIANSIGAFEEGAIDVMTLDLAKTSELEMSDVYREVRRARQFGRPLSLITLESGAGSSSETINRFLEEVQEKSVRRYIDARLIDLVAHRTKDCDILTRCGDHLMLVLPEVPRHQAEKIVDRLRDEAKRELGLDLDAGLAIFPDEEVTFAGLLERAVAQMRSALELESLNLNVNSDPQNELGSDTI